MFPVFPVGVPDFKHKPVGISAGGGAERQGTVGTSMNLVRLRGVIRAFSRVERMEGINESPSLGGGLSSSSRGVSVKIGHCPGVELGRWSRGGADL